MNPKRKSMLSWQEVENSILILDSRGLKKAHSLNKTASIIWKACDGEHTIDSLVILLSEKFQIEKQDALVDVKLLLQSFKDQELLEEI